MNKPDKKPLLLRKFLYLALSVRLISVIKNWIAIPLAVMGIIDFRKGYVLHLRSGVSFKVHHFMEALTINEIFGGNEYLLEKNNKTRTIIDIGANIGAFSIFAAINSTRSKVFSYEPSGKTFKQLKQNILLNDLKGRIIPNKKAVGGKTGKLRLYDAGISGIKSIYKTRGEEKFEVVEVITLKDIFEKNKLKSCDFLKIDCEGAEYEILFNTPPGLFKKIKRISLEFHEIVRNRDHQDLVELLKKAGYKVRSNYHKIENNIGYIHARR